MAPLGGPGHILAQALGGRTGLWRRLTDFRHVWPVMLTCACAGGVLFFLYFNDSTRCVTGNPLDELHNWHHTWRCVWQK